MDLISKRKATLWLVIILVLFNIFTITMLWFSGGKHAGPERPSSGPKDRTLFSELNLSEEQKKQFDQYRSDYFVIIRSFTSRINQKKYEMMKMLFQSEPDSQNLDSLSDELGLLNAEFEKVRYRQILKMNIIQD